jgi:hypothetical protein
LIDGSLSTLALIFAVAFSAARPGHGSPRTAASLSAGHRNDHRDRQGRRAPSMTQSPSPRKEVRHVNSYLACQLARERQRGMLAQAGQQRLARLAPASRRAERAERRMALRPRSELER